MKKIVLHGGVTEIGDKAFRDWRGLAEVVFAGRSSLGRVGSLAFAGTALEAFVAPDSLRSIGPGAFLGCKSLREVRLNEGLQSLGGEGEGAFQDSGVRAVYVSSTLQRFWKQTFAGCRALKRVEVAEGCRLGLRQFLPLGVQIVVSADAPSTGRETCTGCIRRQADVTAA